MSVHRVRRGALGTIAVGVLLVGVAYLATWAGQAPTVALWSMIAGIAMQVTGFFVLGGARSGKRNRPVFAAAAFVAIVLIGGFGTAVLIPAAADATRSIAGLPLRAAIVLLGVGILPFLVLPFLYAADFDAAGLDEGSLDALREECQRLRDGSAQ